MQKALLFSTSVCNIFVSLGYQNTSALPVTENKHVFGQIVWLKGARWVILPLEMRPIISRSFKNKICNIYHSLYKQHLFWLFDMIVHVLVLFLIVLINDYKCSILGHVFHYTVYVLSIEMSDLICLSFPFSCRISLTTWRNIHNGGSNLLRSTPNLSRRDQRLKSTMQNKLGEYRRWLLIHIWLGAQLGWLFFTQMA